MRWRVALLLLGSLGLAHTESSRAEPERAEPRPSQRWIANGSVPLASWVRSLRIARDGEPILTAPRADAPRRGTAQELARLPVYAHRRGEGCRDHWYLVGPSAWVCGDHATPDRLPPDPVRAAPRSFENGLALQYQFVREGGTAGYASLALLNEGIDDVELEEGFALGLTSQARNRSGEPVARTTHDLWVQVNDLRPARPSRFAGLDLSRFGGAGVEGANTGAPATLPETRFGWVHLASAPVTSSPGGKPTGEVLARLSPIQIQEERVHQRKTWLRIGPERWIREAHARVRRPAPIPSGLSSQERWLDVDTERQIVTAYEGTQAVFSTLTSTGKGGQGSPQETPKGAHRIWVKLVYSDMDNLEDAEAKRYYAMQAVPWVMFFKQGYGVHGAYWHESFGNVRSQGCVNLAPRDAERLFEWSRPALPAGWSAILPTEHDPGTLVVIR